MRDANLTVRGAVPEDADFLARISLIASRAHIGWGLYDVVLGLADEEMLPILARLTTTEAPFFHHYTRRLVAEVEGEPAAAIAGFPNTEEFRQTFSPALAEALGAERLPVVAARREPWLRCAIEPPEGAWVVELVATLPSCRGRGLAAELLDAVLERGRELGHTEAAITYEIGNEPAARAYEAAGFVLFRERRDPVFEQVFRVPGLVQVRRHL